jgi:phosphate transport system permease protein
MNSRHDNPNRVTQPELRTGTISRAARRRLLDLGFSALGAFLVLLSLSVLVILFGQLVRDGTGRIASGHYVKKDGFAPSLRELVGTLQRKKEAADNAQWLLIRDPLQLDISTVQGADLAALDGKTVLVEGDAPQPGAAEMTATTITQTEGELPARYSRDAIPGVLYREKNRWMLRPHPLPLDFSEANVDPETLAGASVCVDVGMSRSFPLKVRECEPVVFQSFFAAMPSREAERAGIKSALVGSILVVLVTMLTAVPLGVASGVYLEEYGRKNWLTALIEINIANLAGVPSIIWGLMALGLLVYTLGLGRSIATAGITLGLLVLPIVIISTREAIRAIPNSIREASLACGATRWQTTWGHIIPYSMSGILTGSIIGLSRAIGETAPLITIGALTYIAFLPEFSWSNPFAWLKSGFTVLPIQMFNWISRPDKAFHENAAAAGIVLLVLTLSLNAVAIVIRYRLRKHLRW